jgi:hypothetical protein
MPSPARRLLARSFMDEIAVSRLVSPRVEYVTRDTTLTEAASTHDTGKNTRVVYQQSQKVVAR